MKALFSTKPFTAGLFRTLVGLIAGAGLALAASGVMAQAATASRAAATVGAMAANAAVVRVDLAAGASSQSLILPQGKSAVVDLPIDARDVLVSNPAVAQAMLRTPRRIYVIGLKSGVTDAVFFDATGRRILTLNVQVDQNTSALADTINRVVPGSHVQVESLSDSVILTGVVASAADADKAAQIAAATVTKPEQVINMLAIAGKDQVMLKVRIVEMQRNIIKQLGFNYSAILGQTGLGQLILGTTSTFGINGSLLGGLNGGFFQDTTVQPEVQIPCASPPFPTGSLCPIVSHNTAIATPQKTAGSNGLNKGQANIQAFEQVGLVRTLAEPNLTAVSGEAAKFLVGGEFPVPTGQDATGKISIEFKPFGIGLGFTPVVLSGGRISLKMSTEVSELSNQGAFALSNGAGAPQLVVPSLIVRRAETTVELPSGGALMIAGLLQDTSKQDLASLPGLMNLPVLGALFRSRDYLAGQTELVVIVTPYLVNAASPADLHTPIDGLQTASDLETDLMGKLNKTYNHPPSPNAGRTYQGPYGYVVE
ncbi:MAG: type II and III secretion system protein family protein [Caulobacterales bacterium]